MSQVFNIPKERKDKYGEITTPYWLIEEMIDVLLSNLEKEEIRTATIADCAAGYGYFGIVLYNKLFNHSAMKYLIEEEREKNIKSRIHVYEINKFHREELEKHFQNVYIEDFLKCDKTFDIVIGNPPYHMDGVKKVPTNDEKDKTKDGKTIWREFVKKGVNIADYVLMITPSIWMNNIGEYTYLHIHSYTNTETNRIFKGKAQTPSCYFLINRTNDGVVKVLENGLDKKEMVKNWKYVFGQPIPLCNYSDIRILERIREKYNLSGLNTIKTNCISRKITVSNQGNYLNIKSAHMERRDGQMIPIPIVEYSNEPLMYYGVAKIVCAHKMYGLPIADLSGVLGISARDNYVFDIKDRKYAQYLQYYLHSDIVQRVMNSTRYRMKYLEKYCWKFIPDLWEIDKIKEFDYGTSLCECRNGNFVLGVCDRLKEFNELILELSENL